MLERLDHFNVRARDLDATRAFYVDVLGLTDGWRPPFDFPGHWLYVGDVPVLHLVGARPGEAPAGRDAEDTGNLDHVAFIGRDMEGFITRLEGLGVPMRVRRVPGGGTQQVFVRDPNGVTIELNFPPDRG